MFSNAVSHEFTKVPFARTWKFPVHFRQRKGVIHYSSKSSITLS